MTDNTKPAFSYYPTLERTGTFSGGVPYLAEGEEHPKDNDGNLLQFLFQMDLSEVPEGLVDDLPNKGYLQFFLPVNDDLYGWNSADTRNSAVVVRHILDGDASHGQKADHDPEDTPLLKDKQTFYKGKLEEIPIHPSDEVDGDEEPEDAIVGNSDFEYPEFYVGGSPVFTQYDFRPAEGAENDILVLGSDSGGNVMWGDVGAGGFWLPAEADGDISKIYLYWDCY